MASNELKLCKCGGIAEYYNGVGVYWIVHEYVCRDCKRTSYWQKTIDEATANWNKLQGETG